MAPDVTHFAFEERCVFGSFFPQLLLFLCFHDGTCCFHSLVFQGIKNEEQNSFPGSQSATYTKLVICAPLG